MKNKPIIKTIFVSLNLLSLVGCSITTLPKDVRNSIGQTDTGIQNATDKLSKARSIKQDNFINHTSTGYFGDQVIMQNNTDFLPPIFSNQIQVDKQFYGINSVATTINELTGIPTMVDKADDSGNSDECGDARITQQSGNLIDLLNSISARCDLAWSYHDGKIVLSDTETRTWSIKNIPGDIQVQNQINNNAGIQSQGSSGGSTGSGGGGATGATSQAQSNQSTTQNITFNLQNNIWNNISDSIKAILSKAGRMTISPSTSSVMVTDRPSVLLKIDNYIKNQNSIMKRQVQIDVQVLNVDVNAADNYGINWNAVLNWSGGNFTINGQPVAGAGGETGGGSGTGGGGTGGSTLSGGINPIFIPTNTTQAFTFGSTAGAFNGSNLIINALSSIAKTSLVTSTAVTTLSNQPVPIQFVDQMAYLASVQTTMSGGGPSGGFSQTALTPGQLTTGFSLNVLPVVQANGNVFLQLSINISVLKNMAQYTSNGSSIQLPDILQRNLMQKAVVRNGDTFIVTGFDSDTQALTNTGVGGAYNWLFGGGVSANKARTRMIILVTPRVVNM